jgi:hypothetical protein
MAGVTGQGLDPELHQYASVEADGSLCLTWDAAKHDAATFESFVSKAKPSTLLGAQTGPVVHWIRVNIISQPAPAAEAMKAEWAAWCVALRLLRALPVGRPITSGMRCATAGRIRASSLPRVRCTRSA